MTPARWKQVSQLYEAARARPARERAAFLADACGGDATLQREVESLLDQPTSPPRLDGLTPSVVTHAMGEAPHPSLTGRRFGVYLVGERLDSGGMGDVYRARDTQLGRDVAIKVLQPAFASDPDRLARFEREARILAALDHPHIGTIYGVEESDPSTGSGPAVRALVLALVEGNTLAERIARGPLPITDAIEYARQIADALEAAHDKGIVHRDLKPGNIKITPGGVVKVLDFGLAKALGLPAFDGAQANDVGHDAADRSRSPTLTMGGTQEGVILGTAAYMSPEQARGQPVDKRADIWAFGCVLYEMLTGTVAFPGDTVSDTIAAILGRDVDWRALPEATPASVRRLLHRCLAKDPVRRLRDIADARLEVEEPLAGPSVVPLGTGTSRWAARAGWIAAAAFFVTTIALGALTLMRSSPVDSRVYRSEMAMPAGFESAGPPGRFAVSPDGRRVAFVAREQDDSTSLWVRTFDEPIARRLAGTEGGEHPFWSPDSRTIAFFADRKLKKIAASGGATFTLCDAGRFVQGGAWSRDNVVLFTFGAGPLFRVAADGGTPEQVTTLEPSETGHAFPFFLPDGKRFLYTGYSVTQTVADRGEYVGGVYVGSLDSPGRTQVLDRISNAEYAAGQMLFVRDGALLAQPLDLARLATTGEPVVLAERLHLGVADAQLGAFSAAGAGVLVLEGPTSPEGSRLVWVDRQGRRIRTVGNVGNYENEVTLSPDGSQVLVARSDRGEAPDLFAIDLTTNLERRLTTNSASDRMGIWSPDGTQVVFGRRHQGPHALYVKAASGAASESLLVAGDVNHLPASWSPDGRFLLYGKADFWVLPVDGERKPWLFLQTPANNMDAQFSPDGRWVVYCSSESGRFEIYVTPFSDTDDGRDGGTHRARWLVSTGTAFGPRWRRNEIFYWSSDSNKLMAVPVRAVGRRITVGRAEALFDARPRLESQPFHFYDVTADGQRFLVNGVDTQSGAASLQLIVNWPALVGN